VSSNLRGHNYQVCNFLGLSHPPLLSSLCYTFYKQINTKHHYKSPERKGKPIQDLPSHNSSYCSSFQAWWPLLSLTSINLLNNSIEKICFFIFKLKMQLTYMLFENNPPFFLEIIPNGKMVGFLFVCLGE
jgi:hypothetical protein